MTCLCAPHLVGERGGPVVSSPVVEKGVVRATAAIEKKVLYIGPGHPLGKP